MQTRYFYNVYFIYNFYYRPKYLFVNRAALETDSEHWETSTMPRKAKTQKTPMSKIESRREPELVPEREPQPETGRWLTPSQAMKYLGISHQTLYNLMNDGTLPFYTIKNVRKRRIKKEDLDALMEKGIPGSKDDEA